MMRGCLPAARTGKELKFGAYISVPDLAPAPTVLHNANGPALSVGMLGNDSYSCCVEVSANRYRQRQIAGFSPNEAGVLADYSAATGFDVNKKGTDQGTEPVAFMTQWQAKGYAGSGQIAGWAEVDLFDGTELTQAIVLTKAVMACLGLPKNAEAYFPHPWNATYVGDKGADGHCILLDGYDQTNANVQYDRVTWGDWTEGGIDSAFLALFGDIGMVAIPKEWLAPGGAPAGVNQAKLIADLQQIANLES